MTGYARGLGLTRDPLGRAPYLGPVIFGPSEYVFGILFAVLGVSSKSSNTYLLLRIAEGERAAQPSREPERGPNSLGIQ